MYYVIKLQTYGQQYSPFSILRKIYSLCQFVDYMDTFCMLDNASFFLYIETHQNLSIFKF